MSDRTAPGTLARTAEGGIFVNRKHFVLALAAILLAACAPPAATPAQAPLRITLTLDWVPNTNHTGFYVALEKGWYREEGLELVIQVPSDPSASLKQVAYGNTEFGISFQEEVTIARSIDIPVVSIAAIIQHNTSAFAALAEKGIRRPKDLEGRTYASWGMAIERPILSQLMACDGADVSKLEFVDVGFDVFPAIIGKRADVAWIFLGWDGVQAGLMGAELSVLPLYGSCVPDYYTPVIIAGESTLAERPDLVRRFMTATTRGYEYAIAHPREAAEILLRASPESAPELVQASQAWLSPRYQDDAPRWGVQSQTTWSTFAEFMLSNGLIGKAIEPAAAFSNDYLPD
jgi:ABC-type nitrate/sulfonate/bicarbonate transport system substrate-binding protein